MNILKKLFIKNYTDVKNPVVRTKYGIVAGIFGIISNLILFGLKIFIGVIGNSITIIADAINNLSDAGSSVVTVIGFKLSSRPADKEHPYGHERYEYITALIISFLVLAIGILLGKNSIEKIIAPEDIATDIWTFIILGVAIFVKLWQMLIYRNFGKAINSNALIATSEDSRNDVLTTLAVLIATIIMAIFHIKIDGYVGLLVSIFILISSVKLVKETIDPLLGTVPDKELVSEIKQKILSYDGVLGIHDMMVHNYGASHCFVTVHVEVSSDENIKKCHDLMDQIERDIKSEMNIELTIHMDPIDIADVETLSLKKKISEALAIYNSSITLHDFRIVSGISHTNILFDVVLPYGVALSEEQIISIADEAIDDKEKKYYFIINIDNTMV